MDDKDILNGLLQLAKIHRDQFDERRRTEWKFVFVVIAFYFSLITTKITHQIEFNKDQYWLIALVIFGIAIVACIYLANIHKANHKNKSAAAIAENLAEKLLGYSGKIFTKEQLGFLGNFCKKIKEKSHHCLNWSSVSQWLLLIFISIGTYLVITSKNIMEYNL